MPDRSLNPPSSPPAEPVISQGLATRVGQVSGAVFGLVALITAVLDGDHTAETITALVLSALSLLTLMAGRYAQAYAIDRDAPAPQAVEEADPYDDDFSDEEEFDYEEDEPDFAEPPDEETLRAQMPEPLPPPRPTRRPLPPNSPR
jgi:hypothetical protein